MSRSSSAVAIRLALEHTPALIVSDLLLPGVDGFALARALRATFFDERCPRLFAFTTLSGAREDALSAGFHRVFNKPSDFAPLVDACAQALRAAATGE